MKKIRSKRFDMNKKPVKTRLWVRLVLYVASPFYMLFNKARVTRDKAIKKIKGPFITLCTHGSFMDFPMLVRAIRPRMTNWVIAVDEFRRGDYLMRSLGGIPKRKFTHDICTVKNILDCIKNKKRMVTFYPEARFEFAGICERIDGALGKLVKQTKVPLAMFKCYGNFINSPQWSKHPYRRIRHEGHLSLLVSQEEANTLSAQEIQERIEKAFVKDEYKWQAENNIHVKCKKRADGLYRILYKCPVCGEEFKMESAGTHLWCNACGAKWEMDTLSRLNGVNTDKGFSHIPDWYNWEREEVRKEVRAGTYRFEDQVRVEDFYSPKVGCLDVGTAQCVHDKNGWTIKGVVEGKEFCLEKPLQTMYSLHIEYNFLERGDAFDIATTDRTYFMFPLNAKNVITKLHFAQEELYDYYIKEGNK